MKSKLILLNLLFISASFASEAAMQIKWKSDFRFRNEFKSSEGSDGFRYRQRIKAKMGFEALTNEYYTGGLELSTGVSDPVSTNMTLGKDGTTSDFGLNLAFVKMETEPVVVSLGKMKNTMQAALKSELIWDGDLNPEGVALGLRFGKESKIKINNQAFWLREDPDKKDNITWVQSHQLILEQKLSDHKLIVISGYHDFHNTISTPVFAGEAAHNSVDKKERYLNDYNLLEGGLEFNTELLDRPLSVGGSYVQNLAISQKNKGFEAAVKLNKAKKAHSWQAKFTYRKTESDCTIGAFSDSDFNGGGTLGEGFEFNGRYQLTKELFFDYTQFVNSTPNKKKSGKYASQIDVNYKF